MNHQPSMGKVPGHLRTIVLTILWIGAAASLGLMFYTGRRNPSILLMLLFTGWVLSPFLALQVVELSKRLPVPRALLYGTMLIITIGSLLAYSGILLPPDAKPAFIFLITPLVSWVVIVLVIPIALRYSRKDKNKEQP